MHSDVGAILWWLFSSLNLSFRVFFAFALEKEESPETRLKGAREHNKSVCTAISIQSGISYDVMFVSAIKVASRDLARTLIESQNVCVNINCRPGEALPETFFVTIGMCHEAKPARRLRANLCLGSATSFAALHSASSWNCSPCVCVREQRKILKYRLNHPWIFYKANIMCSTGSKCLRHSQNLSCQKIKKFSKLIANRIRLQAGSARTTSANIWGSSLTDRVRHYAQLSEILRLKAVAPGKPIKLSLRPSADLSRN